MCLITFAKNFSLNYKLILAANRDEFYERPTKQAFKWDEGIIGGKDLKAGGMWFGVDKSGRFAALTNYRNGNDKRVFDSSRGDLVKDFLVSKINPKQFLEKLKLSKNNYAGYNIIFGDADKIFYYSNVADKKIIVNDGIHGLSNAFLDTGWFKVKKSKEEFEKITTKNPIVKEEIFDLMIDQEKAKDSELPKTGIPFELEKEISSIFINMPQYGTRSTTILTIGLQNRIEFIERTYGNGSKDFSEVSFELM